MGNLMRIAELQGQVERKDAYIDKLELKLDEVTTDRDQRAELSARLFSENEQLKHQLNLKQLEVDHCHAVCGELRQKLTAVAGEQDDLIVLLQRWRNDSDAYPADDTLNTDTDAALARAKVGA